MEIMFSFLLDSFIFFVELATPLVKVASLFLCYVYWNDVCIYLFEYMHLINFIFWDPVKMYRILNPIT